VTGAGYANASYGIPDIGLVGVDSVVEHVRRIADVFDIPVVVDADTGYGGVLNVARTVRQLERAGAAAMQLEDRRRRAAGTSWPNCPVGCQRRWWPIWSRAGNRRCCRPVNCRT
jgi:2-methylisocitrate lyase-like PEP mutase family enzyme